MQYAVAFAPELDVNAADFAQAWNDSSDSRPLAEAVVGEAKSVTYLPPGVSEALIFLAGAAGTVAVDVLKDVIKTRLNAYLAKKYPVKATPKIDVQAVRQPDGAYLLVVKGQ